MKNRPLWRQSVDEHLQAIRAIADVVHPTLKERPEVLAEKCHLFPSGCFSLWFNDEVLGYAISHPWRLHDVPPLDAFLQGLPGDADCLYLHDIAILPGARGYGSTAALVKLLEKVAATLDLPFLALTSVYGTEAFWTRFKFHRSGKMTGDGIASYGGASCYMIRRVRK